MSRAFQAGTLRYEILSSGASHSHTVSVTLPGGGTATIPTDVGTSGIVGPIAAGSLTVTFNDTDDDFPGSWTDGDASHCQVSTVEGGYIYGWDDTGPGGTQDKNFTDLVMQLRVAPDVVGPTGAAVRVAVYEPDTVTLIANVPRRRNVKWLEEMNDPGSAQFEIHLDDEVIAFNPTLLSRGNVVKFILDGVNIKTWTIEGVNPPRLPPGGESDRWAVVSGRGPSAALENGVVFPENGLNELVPEDRYFNFASADGIWVDPTDWVTPGGIAWHLDTTGRAGKPKGWPDPTAQWLWSPPGPTADVKPGINWFRGTFTLTDDTSVIIYATGDNTFTAYMDGVVILSSGTNYNAFRKVYQYQTTLAAGDHTFAAKATNLGGGTSGTNNNPAGFIATIFRADSSGTVTADNVWRTTPANMDVKAYGDAPGWNGATILQQLVIEAQARGVDSLLPVTFDFDNSVDSYGSPWDDLQDRSVKIGTTDLADLATQVVELTLDMMIGPDYVMHAWKRLGLDKSDTVIIRPGRDIVQDTPTINASRIRNHMLLKFDGGWMELAAPNSEDKFGRREVGVSLGTSASVSQTKLAGKAALRETVDEDVTIPLSYTSVAGPQPYTDFYLGDIILVPDEANAMTRARLMSISGSELGEGGAIQWDLDFYPAIDDSAISTTVVATGGAHGDISTLYEHEVLSDSPWGYWRLKETAGTIFTDDASHVVRTLHMGWTGGGTTNKPTLNQPGPVESAVTFNTATGTGSGPFNMAHARTEISTESWPVIDDAALKKLFNFKYATFEVWLKPSTTPGARAGVMLMYDPTDNSKGWELGVDSAGKAFFQYNDTTGTTNRVVSSAVLPTASWTHVVGSKGVNGLKLYVNGVLDQHLTGLGTPQTDGYEFALRGDIEGDVVGVEVAEPAVFFQQLTDSRVKSHWKAAAYTP